MHGAKALLILVAYPALASDFSGSSALKFAVRAAAFGPRPPGSAANRQLAAYILSQLRPLKCTVREDSFQARTPLGPIGMKNIVARFSGSSGRAVAFTGHYDTKRMPGIRFVGANDGGSSTALLLELARVLSARRHKDEVLLVWFDGEEAIGEWSDTDGLYGSRRLAAMWSRDGTAARVKALINVDMIGDKDLGIFQELASSESLRTIVWQVAADLGYRRHFLDSAGFIEDDHAPFLRAGISALDLIDFDYGPHNSYWHTEKDTIDKLSPDSFQAVGDVLLETMRRLEEQ